MENLSERGSGNGWRFVLNVVFLGLMLIAGCLLKHMGADLTKTPTVFEFMVLSLAVFRLIRLMTADTIMHWSRDLFLDTKAIKKRGVVYVERKKPANGLKRSIADLLGCPWCIGVWLSLFVLFLFYVSPYAYPFLVLMAISGLGTFLRIISLKVGS